MPPCRKHTSLTLCLLLCFPQRHKAWLHHTKQWPFNYGEGSCGSASDYCHSNSQKFCLCNQTRNMASFDMITTSNTSSSFFTRSKNYLRNSDKKPYFIISVHGLCKFCVNETSSLLVEFSKATNCLQRCWVHWTLLHYCSEQAGPVNVFTTLPQTLKSSNPLKLKLCKRISPCLGI